MSARASDERVAPTSLLTALMRRPEMGAVSGALLVFLLFFLVASPSMFSARGVVNWLTVSGQLGVIAVSQCLLMIAGEFDLSVGSMIGFSGMVMALLFRFADLPAWAAIFSGFAICLCLGMLIGVIRVKSGLSSFIVTLAFLFILRGATIVSARVLNGSTLVGGMRDAKQTDPLAWLLGGQFGQGVFSWLAEHGMLAKLPNGTPTVTGLPMIILWCLVLGAAAALVLANSRFGNWIFSAGGDPRAAAVVGVPVGRVKIRLFVYSAFCASVFGAAQVFEYGSADASRGELKEFESIIAAVIGGALLTGGYGSVIGALVGALIFGVVSQGFFYTGVDGDWFRIFLGCVLLGAVAFNTQLRKRVTGGY
ncbi:MAG: ABC transporter permease [Alphaproteobacteria bacterium]|nr:ABC transporter permease [Alphaproteobacteria bacterium]